MRKYGKLVTLPECSNYCIFVVPYICALETPSPEPECKTAKTTDDKCCSLPFTYKGVTYNSCTNVDHNKLWCSLDANYKGKWGNCGKY